MENELSRVADALPALVWAALPDGHIDFLNQRWCECTGLSVSLQTRGCGGCPQFWRHSDACCDGCGARPVRNR
jgi:PAS domain-containing protein